MMERSPREIPRRGRRFVSFRFVSFMTPSIGFDFFLGGGEDVSTVFLMDFCFPMSCALIFEKTKSRQFKGDDPHTVEHWDSAFIASGV